MEARRVHDIVYPDSDGEPMSDNTLQYEWIVTLKGNLDARLPDFVGGDLLWYPVQGNPKERRAPDVLVALGRPKGYRGSYKQWEEAGHPPNVVMEVMSPKNTVSEMVAKLRFYERHGATEYYVVDPDHHSLQVWIRNGVGLREVPVGSDFVSPLLGIRFVVGEELRVFHPDGAPFLTFSELARAHAAAATERDAAATERDAVAIERDAVAIERDAALARIAELEARLAALEPRD